MIHTDTLAALRGEQTRKPRMKKKRAHLRSEPDAASLLEASTQTLERKIPLERLFEVKLPAGEVRGFDVMFRGDHSQRYNELPAGYDGWRFKGEGIGVTHVRDPDSLSHDSSIFIGPFNGTVELVGMTVHNARLKGIHAGLATKQWDARVNDYVAVRSVLPKFKLSTIDVEVVADAPWIGANGRPAWGVFTYQCDVRHKRIVGRWKLGRQHFSYEHGYASEGSNWNSCTVEGVAGEGTKVRPDSQEIVWTQGARIERVNCKITDFAQAWSDFGGGGGVMQGTGLDMHFKRCEIWGGPNQRGRCLMIDDGGVRHDGKPDYYSAIDGAMGGKFANGFVIIDECCFAAGPGPDWYTAMMRIGNLHNSATYPRKVSRGVLIQDCGVWGYKMLGQFSDSPILIRGCNTPAIREYCSSIGMDTTYEAMISGNPLVPFSRGRTAEATR